jgi:hypothetical protein
MKLLLVLISPLTLMAAIMTGIIFGLFLWACLNYNIMRGDK